MVINTVLKRTGLGITQSEHVNTFVEAMPRDFKYGYLKGVENKRLDIRLIDQVRGQDGLILTEFFFFFPLSNGPRRGRRPQNSKKKSLYLPDEYVKAEEDDVLTVFGEDGGNFYKECRIVNASEEFEQNGGLRYQGFCSVFVHLYVSSYPDCLIPSDICNIHIAKRYSNGSLAPQDNTGQHHSQNITRWTLTSDKA